MERLRPFKRGLRLLGLGLAVVACCLLLLAVLSRGRVNAELRTRLEAEASKAVGLAVEVGEVRGSWWWGLTLQDVRVHAGPGLRSPLLASAPEVRLEYAIASLLLGGDPRLGVDVYDAEVSLTCRKDGQIDLFPRQAPPGPIVPAPAVALRFHGGRVAYVDRSRPRPFTAELKRLSGDGQVEGTAVSLALQAMRGADVVTATATYDWGARRGNVKAEARGLALPYWVNRFAQAPQYRLEGGRGDVEAFVSWEDPLTPRRVKLDGNVRFRDGRVALTGAARPLTGIAGEARFTEDGVFGLALGGTWEGAPFSVSGELGRWLEGDPALDLDLTADGLTGPALTRIYPFLAPEALGGTLALRAQVGGRLQAPDARFALAAHAPRWRGGRFEEALARGTYRPGGVTIAAWRAREADGARLSGSASLRLAEDAPEPLLGARLAVRARHWDAGAWLFGRLKALPPPPLETAGRWNAEAELVFGPGGRALTHLSGRLASSGPLRLGALGGLQASARFAGSPQQLKLSDARLSGAGGTRLALAGATFSPASFALRDLRGELPGPALAALHPAAGALPPGSLTLAVSDYAAPLPHPARGTGALTLSWRGAAAGPSGSAELRLAPGTLTVEGGQLTGPGLGRVAFSGRLGRDARGLPASGALRLASVAPARLAELSAAWRGASGLRGELSAAGELRLGPAGPTFAGHLTGTGLAGRGWGPLARVEADGALTAGGLRLARAHLIAGPGAEARLAGSLAFGAGPDLASRLKAGRLDGTLQVSGGRLAPWLARLDPERAFAPEPDEALPASGSRRFEPLAGPGEKLQETFARWARYRKLGPAEAPATGPLPRRFDWRRDLDGVLALKLDARGPVAAPAIALEGRLEAIRLGEARLERAEVRASRPAGEAWCLERARVSADGHTILTAGGRLGERRGGGLAVALHEAPLTLLSPWLGPRGLRLDGTLSGEVRAFGPPSALSAAGTLTAQGGTLAPRAGDWEPLRFETLTAKGAYAGGRLKLDRLSLEEGGRTASATLDVPLAAGARFEKAPLAGELRLEGAQLAWLNLLLARRAEWLGGDGEASVKLGGTWEHPALQGFLRMRDGRLRLKGLDAPLTGAAANLHFDTGGLTIAEAKASYRGGPLALAGSIDWESFVPLAYDLRLEAGPLGLAEPGLPYAGRAEAELTLRGPAASPALGGRLELQEGVLRLLEGGEAAGVARPGEALFAALNGWRFAGLQVALGPGVRLSHPAFDLGLTSPGLSVSGPLGSPSLRGAVSLEDGTLRAFNTRFSLEEGRVRFKGAPGAWEAAGDARAAYTALAAGRAPGLEAELDVTARTLVYDYRERETVNVIVRLQGELERWQGTLRAEPIRSEQEILNILSRKQVLDQASQGRLETGEVLTRELGGLVNDQLASWLAPGAAPLRRAMGLKRLDFELVPDADKSGFADAVGLRPAMTVETQPLWRDLSLTSRLVAGALYDPTPLTKGDASYVGLTWRLNRRLAAEYRLDPYLDPSQARLLDHSLGLKTRWTF